MCINIHPHIFTTNSIHPREFNRYTYTIPHLSIPSRIPINSCFRWYIFIFFIIFSFRSSFSDFFLIPIFFFYYLFLFLMLVFHSFAISYRPVSSYSTAFYSWTHCKSLIRSHTLDPTKTLAPGRAIQQPKRHTIVWHTYIYVWILLFIPLPFSLSLSLYLCIVWHTHIYVCICAVCNVTALGCTVEYKCKNWVWSCR